MTPSTKIHKSPVQVFLSYSFSHQRFVDLIQHQLLTQPAIRPYLYTQERDAREWDEQLKKALANSRAFVSFIGNTLGKTQEKEMQAAFLSAKLKYQLWVKIAGSPSRTAREFCQKKDPIRVHALEVMISQHLDQSKTASSPAIRRQIRNEADKMSINDLGDEELQIAAEQCAREITERLGFQWLYPPIPPVEASLDRQFDLPLAYPFDYEKTIIDAFVKGHGSLPQDKVDAGCTVTWPAVVKRSYLDNHRGLNYQRNPVPREVVGDYRELDAEIIVDARAKKLRAIVKDLWNENSSFLTLPEAGPRAEVCYPLPHRNNLKVGILVSGGIAPGINAAIDGIVKRHILYANPSSDGRHRRDPLYDLEILGLRDGLAGLLHGTPPILLHELSSEKAHTGGSLLRTSREDNLLTDQGAEVMDDIVQRLSHHGIDILYVIGGDGSMRASHAIYSMAQRKGKDLSVVTIPKAMDNDILWVWQSFGFLSAVEYAKEAILQLHVEATSNPRLCVIQLFGSDSGFVASHAALTSGICDYVLIPEVGFRMQTVIECMTRKLQERYRKTDESPHGLIVMAETAIPRDYKDYYKTEEVGLTPKEVAAVDDFVRRQGRVHGQTPDHLRNAALKIVEGSLRAAIRKIETNPQYWSRYRVFTNEPRHLIRAIRPSTADVIFGERLGTLAVDGAMAGYSDCMVSQWMTEYVFVPLKLVILGRKRVPPKGIFWRTVLANTGQPDEDLPPWS